MDDESEPTTAQYNLRKAARLKREEMIAELQSCECAWPLKRWRSTSTHDPKCPVDIGRKASKVEGFVRKWTKVIEDL